MTDLSERLRARVRQFDSAAMHHEISYYSKGDDKLDLACAAALDAKDVEIARLAEAAEALTSAMIEAECIGTDFTKVSKAWRRLTDTIQSIGRPK